MHPIFISYRRSDLSLEAEWIYNLISSFFGSDIIFFDKEKIESGNRWDETLRQRVAGANVVLVLIGPKWLKEQQDSGMRRLDDPKDWVRIEVETAISQFTQHAGKKWVYPVLVNEAILPRQEWLPDALSTLTAFQLEPALSFHIKNYQEAAKKIYAFINATLGKLLKAGLIAPFKSVPFHSDKVPSPYELPGYQLPETLRTSRPAFPFKGLEYFTREDARIFFGRRKETGEIIDAFKKSQLVIRLYGQSGVGKSSLLFAGLLPRLEAAGWRINYFRRRTDTPIGQQLADAIEKQQPFDDQDALIILDQLEEIITNPAPGSADELEALSVQLARLDSINANRYEHPIRLIISYRKEYDVEIKNALRAQKVTSNEYWLKDLDEAGMQEAITGITKDQDLVDEYQLLVEKNLDTVIVQDLLGSSSRSDATPLLQFVLRKMWDRISVLDKDHRIFTKQLYEECKSNGLKELLLTQLTLIPEKINPDLKEGIESGLAIDVLSQFTTLSDTAAAQPAATVLEHYENSELVKKLLQAMVDTYLLVRTEHEVYRVPHDSLAKAIRILCNNSLYPGQRALRLIESKQQDIEEGKDVEFSRRDLAIIDAGKNGMRKWTSSEANVIEKSRNKLAEQELTFERLATESQIKAKKALSNFLTSQSMLAWNQEKNLTKATRLAAYAAAVSPLVPSLKNLFYCYDMAYAYPAGQLLRSSVDEFRLVSFMALNADESKLIFVSLENEQTICAYDFSQQKLQPLFRYAPVIELFVCSPFQNHLFVYNADGSARFHQLDTNNYMEVKLAEKPEPDSLTFWNASTLIYHSKSIIYCTDLMTGKSRVFAETENKELIYTFALSEDRKYAAIATRTKKLLLLETASMKMHQLMEHDSIISIVFFLSAQELLIMDTWRGVYAIAFVEGKSSQYQQRINANFMEGGTLAAHGHNGMIGFTDRDNADTIHLLGTSRTDQITGIQEVFSKLLIKKDGSCVITLGHSGVLLWPLHRNEKQLFITASKEMWCHLHHYSDQALIFTETAIHVIDIFTQQSKSIYETGAALLEKGYYCMNTGSFFQLMKNKSILHISLTAQQQEEIVLPFESEYFRMAAGDTYLAVRGENNEVNLFEFATRQWKKVASKDSVWTIAFSSNGMIALGGQEGRVDIYPAGDYTRPVFAFQKLTKQLLWLQWSADNEYLFAGGYNSFGVLCHLKTKNFLKLQHAHWIAYAAYANTQPWIATCCFDKIVRIFLLETGELLRELRLHANPEQCHFTARDHTLIIRLATEACVEWTLTSEMEIQAWLTNNRIEDLSEPEQFELGIVDYMASAKPGSDYLVPFTEDLPPQLNL